MDNLLEGLPQVGVEGVHEGDLDEVIVPFFSIF